MMKKGLFIMLILIFITFTSGSVVGETVTLTNPSVVDFTLLVSGSVTVPLPKGIPTVLSSGAFVWGDYTYFGESGSIASIVSNTTTFVIVSEAIFYNLPNVYTYEGDTNTYFYIQIWSQSFYAYYNVENYSQSLDASNNLSVSYSYAYIRRGNSYFITATGAALLNGNTIVSITQSTTIYSDPYGTNGYVSYILKPNMYTFVVIDRTTYIQVDGYTLGAYSIGSDVMYASNHLIGASSIYYNSGTAWFSSYGYTFSFSNASFHSTSSFPWNSIPAFLKFEVSSFTTITTFWNIEQFCFSLYGPYIVYYLGTTYTVSGNTVKFIGATSPYAGLYLILPPSTEEVSYNYRAAAVVLGFLGIPTPCPQVYYNEVRPVFFGLFGAYGVYVRTITFYVSPYTPAAEYTITSIYPFTVGTDYSAVIYMTGATTTAITLNLSNGSFSSGTYVITTDGFTFYFGGGYIFRYDFYTCYNIYSVTAFELDNVYYQGASVTIDTQIYFEVDFMSSSVFGFFYDDYSMDTYADIVTYVPENSTATAVITENDTYNYENNSEYYTENGTLYLFGKPVFEYTVINDKTYTTWITAGASTGTSIQSFIVSSSVVVTTTNTFVCYYWRCVSTVLTLTMKYYTFYDTNNNFVGEIIETLTQGGGSSIVLIDYFGNEYVYVSGYFETYFRINVYSATGALRMRIIHDFTPVTTPLPGIANISVDNYTKITYSLRSVGTVPELAIRGWGNSISVSGLIVVYTGIDSRLYTFVNYNIVNYGEIYIPSAIYSFILLESQSGIQSTTDVCELLGTQNSYAYQRVDIKYFMRTITQTQLFVPKFVNTDNAYDIVYLLPAVPEMSFSQSFLGSETVIVPFYTTSITALIFTDSGLIITWRYFKAFGSFESVYSYTTGIAGVSPVIYVTGSSSALIASFTSSQNPPFIAPGRVDVWMFYVVIIPTNVSETITKVNVYKNIIVANSLAVPEAINSWTSYSNTVVYFGYYRVTNSSLYVTVYVYTIYVPSHVSNEIVTVEAGLSRTTYILIIGFWYLFLIAFLIFIILFISTRKKKWLIAALIALALLVAVYIGFSLGDYISGDFLTIHTKIVSTSNSTTSPAIYKKAP